MSNKKIMPWLYCWLLLMMMLPMTASAELNNRYTEKNPVTIVCDWDKPPYEFLDDEGKPAGTNIDVLSKILSDLNIPYRFVMKEWSHATKSFDMKQADLIFANINRFKSDEFYVTQIINYNRIRVAMTKDTTGIISLNALGRGPLVLKTGDYTAMYFKDTASEQAAKIEYQSPKVALTGLKAGYCKYFVWGEEPLKWKIKKLNLEGIYLNDVSIPVSEVHIIGRDKELIDLIDDHYSRLKQSGELEEMLNRWYHPELVHDTVPPYVFYSIFGLLTLAVLAVLFSRLAKAHVKSAMRSSTELIEMLSKAMQMGNFQIMEYDIKNNRFTNRYDSVILPENGLSLEEFTKRIHPDQRAEFTDKIQLLMSGKERSFELDKRWNSGTDEHPVWLNFNGHAMVETDDKGEPQYIVNAIHDITHEVEESMAEKLLVNKYDRMADMPFMGISFYNRGGRLIDVNNTMKQLCHIDDNDPASRRFWESVSIFDVPLFREMVRPGMKEKVQVCQHMYYPDMNIDKYIELQIEPLVNDKNEVVNYFVSAIDKTKERADSYAMHKRHEDIRNHQKQIEVLRQRLNYLLTKSNRYLVTCDKERERMTFFRTPGVPISVDTASTMLSTKLIPLYNTDGNVTGYEGVATDYTSLDTARRLLKEETLRAEQSVQLKSGFMASMTHELRTPLNAIVGFTGILKALDSEDERAEYVRIIRNSCDMLQRLINDIMEASTLTDGQLSIKAEQIDFVPAFDDISITLQQRVQNPDVKFLKENPYDTFVTSLDIGRVQQVLTNFVTNAVKFTERGHIRIGYRYKRHGLYIYCEDTGKGIPKDKQQKIFERFVKLDEFVQGTGMGLAICKSIAERMGGEIGIESEGEGKGSLFWMWIPCVRILTSKEKN